MSAAEPKVDEALAVAHGLKPDEYARLVALIGRDHLHRTRHRLGAVVVTVAGSAGALPGAAGRSVKVTPLHEFPGKGRATGGVRCHRFLKGEDVLVMAWAGPAPAVGATDSGGPVDLPDPVGKRDGSGVALTRQLAVIGSAGRVSRNGWCRSWRWSDGRLDACRAANPGRGGRRSSRAWAVCARSARLPGSGAARGRPGRVREQVRGARGALIGELPLRDDGPAPGAGIERAAPASTRPRRAPRSAGRCRGMPVRTRNARQLWHGPFSQKDRLEHARWEGDAGQSAAQQRARRADHRARGDGGLRARDPVGGRHDQDVDVFSGDRLRKYLRKHSAGARGPRLTASEVERIYTAADRVLRPKR